ncbi:MAG: tRNA threonylcarbamoyladenosine biosynthesis protein TsaB [Solirubrobacteraceae bacterium]|nr:tRNA threonylcarbamoyladenosine biosynthesis protein TsaB [Solirubrobacteraceae bacterium]
MIVLALDTATPATVVGLLRNDGEVFEARHDPAEAERPGHATQLLGLVEMVLESGGCTLNDVELIAAGTGPGSFTGLRIGIATARALAQAQKVPLAGIGTLRALAVGAGEGPERLVVAVLDARRGEAFAAAYAGDRELVAPSALAPDALAAAVRRLGTAAGAPPLAVGDGALRFREHLEAAGAAIPADASPLHRVSARQLCRLAAEAEVTDRDAVLPEYVRPPDARPLQPDRKPHSAK